MTKGKIDKINAWPPGTWLDLSHGMKSQTRNAANGVTFGAVVRPQETELSQIFETRVLGFEAGLTPPPPPHHHICMDELLDLGVSRGRPRRSTAGQPAVRYSQTERLRCEGAVRARQGAAERNRDRSRDRSVHNPAVVRRGLIQESYLMVLPGEDTAESQGEVRGAGRAGTSLLWIFFSHTRPHAFGVHRALRQCLWCSPCPCSHTRPWRGRECPRWRTRWRARWRHSSPWW